MKKALVILMLLMCCSLVNAFADEVRVTMKSGSTIIGELKELIASDHLTLIVAGIESTINMSDVASVEKVTSNQSSIKKNEDDKLVYGQYEITDTKQYPDSFLLQIGDQELTMVLVRGGWFNMGFDGRHSLYWDTEPIHHVNLSSFYISTQPLNKRIVDIIQHKSKPNTSNKPFRTDSRKTADKIIHQLVAETSLPYRFPTESEWEYVAVSPLAQIVFNENGLVEWCNDYWGEYPEIEQTNPQGPAKGNTYVLRSYSTDTNKWRRYKSSGLQTSYYHNSNNASIRIAISADCLTF